MPSNPAPDMRTLVGALEEMTADLGGPTVPWTLLTVLDRLISCEEVAFSEMDHRGRRFVSSQYVKGTVRELEGEWEAPDEPWWALTATAKTVANPQLASPGRVERWTAEYTMSEIKAWPLYQEYWRGVGDLLAVAFPSRPGYTRRLLLWRHFPARFTDQDEALVRLLVPHLFEVDQLARREREGAPQLTAREWQVLQLVAQGATNAEVAAALFTSVATVRKHMEHIFDRSGVRTRSAAVVKLMPLEGRLHRR